MSCHLLYGTLRKNHMDSSQTYQTRTLARRNLIVKALFLIIVLLVADQASKYFIRDLVLDNGGHIEILPFFNLVYVWNYGVSFGMLQMEEQTGVYLLIAMASIITALFAVILVRTDSYYTAIGSAIIIGGSCGNIIDRALYGAVYDFIDFHAFGYHWPAFNVADSCVLIGIAIIAYDSLFLNEKSTEAHEK